MPPPIPQPQICKRCKLSFGDWDAYHKHLVESDRHHACYVCGMEYNNQAALNVHCKLNHAHAQTDLKCVACFKKFSTLGGLTAHIEFDKCFGGNLAAEVKGRTALAHKMEDARNFKGGRSGGKDIPEDEPRPVLRNYAQVTGHVEERGGNLKSLPAKDIIAKAANDPISAQGSAINSPQVPVLLINLDRDTVSSPYFGNENAVTAPEEEDLISFDAPSMIMNHSWDDELPASVQEQFPLLVSCNNPSNAPAVNGAAPAIGTIWSSSSVAAVNADLTAALPAAVAAASTPANATPQYSPWGTMNIPAAAAPISPAPESAPWDSITPPAVSEAELAADFAASLNKPVNTQISPWDPSNPTFRADAYLNEITGKYRCPHPRCKKHTIANRNAFIQHLKSTAHRDERLQCHGCLRYFDNATALAQHASAQGIRCRVRETDNYDNEVDRFTGGHAAPAGRFDDDTIRYVTTSIPQTAQGLIDANRAKMAEELEIKEKYWKTHVMRW